MSTHNIPFLIYKKKRISPKIIPILQLWDFFFKGLKNELETFEPLKIYCNQFSIWFFCV